MKMQSMMNYNFYILLFKEKQHLSVYLTVILEATERT